MKFGVREICDVTFKAAAANQKVGNKVFKKYQPVFMIDTARTSNFEQASTTVYAQGGKGYARLLAWEGEKTMTFTVEDALMSPMGLAVLSGAGLINHATGKDSARVHVTVEKTLDASGNATIELDDLKDETGLDNASSFLVCDCIPVFATVIGASGKAEDFLEADEIAPNTIVDAANDATFEFGATAAGKTVVVDFYLAMTNSVQTITIGPEDFGGYYYIEAQTLFRDEATGKDLAANITFPKVKIQSGFTFTMAASGDPSTFTFTMDAFPGYTINRCDKKTMCDIQILSITGDDEDACLACEKNPTIDTPTFVGKTGVGVVAASALGDELGVNQDKVTVTKSTAGKNDVITLTANVAELENIEPVAGWGAAKYVALDYNTGKETIEGLVYDNRGTLTTLTAADVAEATAAGLPAGHMLVWDKADLPATFALREDEEAEPFVNVTIVPAV